MTAPSAPYVHPDDFAVIFAAPRIVVWSGFSIIFSLSFFALVVVLLLQLMLPRRRGDLPRASGWDLSVDGHALEIMKADVPQSPGDLAFYSTSRGREAELWGVSTFIDRSGRSIVIKAMPSGSTLTLSVCMRIPEVGASGVSNVRGWGEVLKPVR